MTQFANKIAHHVACLFCEDLDGFTLVIFGVLGETLCKTHEKLEHLAIIERILGSIPSHMLKKVGYHAEKYIRKGRLNWPEGATSRESIRVVSKLPCLPG
ncbi:hypothetical protein C5167_043787 [Papaver somniferum]|uniref:Uncharacterized protein n=1 Tax=Papaver somniferum TaxID=3469 RepID=A0A4Y7L8C6_PAPSO|nr:hypothetical protein C5167_043787 [Papaver somniferum]